MSACRADQVQIGVGTGMELEVQYSPLNLRSPGSLGRLTGMNQSRGQFTQEKQGMSCNAGITELRVQGAKQVATGFYQHLLLCLTTWCAQRSRPREKVLLFLI